MFLNSLVIYLNDPQKLCLVLRNYTFQTRWNAHGIKMKNQRKLARLIDFTVIVDSLFNQMHQYCAEFNS